MLKKLPFIIEIVNGIEFVCIRLIIVETDYYSTLFFATGFGLIFASCIQLFRIWYYEIIQEILKFYLPCLFIRGWRISIKIRFSLQYIYGTVIMWIRRIRKIESWGKDENCL